MFAFCCALTALQLEELTRALKDEKQLRKEAASVRFRLLLCHAKAH